MPENKNILSSAPYFDYEEHAPEINAEEFQKVVNSRRSVRIFEKTPVPDSIVEKCLGNALLAPNSSNLQPWEFYRIKSEKARAEMNMACLNQVSAKTAAELIVIVARTDTWRGHAKETITAFNKAKKRVPEAAYSYYGKIVPFVYTQGIFSLLGHFKRILYFLKGLSKPIIREPVTNSHLRLWAVKSTALAAENLMLSFRAYGYDSCPMEGFDSKRVKKIIGLHGKASVVMVIAAGKRSKGGIYGERMRFPSSRFIKTV